MTELEQQVLVRVRLSGGAPARRAWSRFFHGRNDLWHKLVSGEEIDFPESELTAMRGSVERVPGLTPLPSSQVVRVKKDDRGIWHNGVLVEPAAPKYDKNQSAGSPSTDEVTQPEPLPKRRRKKPKSEER